MTQITRRIGNRSTVISGRHVPVSGTEAQRLAQTLRLLENEIHTTSDQKRLFIQNSIVGSVWHGEVANQAAMLALRTSSARGCWPGDLCERADTNTLWVCVSNNGNVVGDWREMSAGGGGGAMDLIAEVLPTGTGLVNFTAIPATYRHLTVRGYGRGTAAAQIVSLFVRLNGDTGANYDLQAVAASNITFSAGQSFAQTSALINDIPAATSPANVASGLEIQFEHYANTTFEKSFRSIGSDKRSLSSIFWRQHVCFWRNTAAINSIQIFTASGNFATGSIFSLYGLK